MEETDHNSDGSTHRQFHRIVEHVEDGIAAGDLSPGDRLPSERELVQQFNIGRASVREALRVLENMGFVKSHPRDPRGPLIQPLTTEPVRRSLSVLTSGGVVSFAELVQFRMVADASANLLAAANRTEADLEAIEQNIETMRSCFQDLPTSGHSPGDDVVADGDRGELEQVYAQFSRADLEFHELIARAGGNRLVQIYGDATREAIMRLIQRTIHDADDKATLMRESLTHHQHVLHAIQNRDGLLASRLARSALYRYYADYVSADQRDVLADLVRESGGDPH